VHNGFHALALDESREAYAPVLWTSPPGWTGNIEQVWFRGAHSDVGGQIKDFPAARPLANISLVWMLKRLEAHNLPLPADWEQRFETDVNAPKCGSWRGWGKVFWGRRKRLVGMDASERLHNTVNPAQYRKVFVRDFQQTRPAVTPQSS